MNSIKSCMTCMTLHFELVMDFSLNPKRIASINVFFHVLFELKLVTDFR